MERARHLHVKSDWHSLEDFFQDLPHEKGRFIDLAVQRKVKKHEFLFFEGDAADSVLYLEEGRVKISQFSYDGREAIIYIHKPGSIIGISGVTGRQPRTSNAQALIPCNLLEIKAQDFNLLLSNYPHLVERTLVALYWRVNYLVEQFSNMVFNNAETRLIKLLTYLHYGQL